MSKLTDYGTVVLACLASGGGRTQTATDVAERTRLATPTVSKLLKSLTRAGLVRSFRGSHGGYALARPAERITAVQIIDALEGPVAITECSGLDSHCEIESMCRVSHAWQHINQAIRRALHEVTLAELAAPLALKAREVPLKLRPGGGSGRSANL